MSRVKQHTTDPFDPYNQKVAIMAELGFHTRAIADLTGLTESQVNSRTLLYGIRRRDYRDGKNEASTRVLSLAVGRMPKPKSRIFQPGEVKEMSNSYNEVREKIRKSLADRAKEKQKRQKSRKGAKASA